GACGSPPRWGASLPSSTAGRGWCGSLLSSWPAWGARRWSWSVRRRPSSALSMPLTLRVWQTTWTTGSAPGSGVSSVTAAWKRRSWYALSGPSASTTRRPDESSGHDRRRVRRLAGRLDLGRRRPADRPRRGAYLPTGFLQLGGPV